MARRRIKKTYKQQQRELEETPEFVEEQLWSMSEWMEENWRPVVAVIGAVTVIWGGIGLYQIYAESSAEAASAESAPVFAALNQPVYEPPKDLKGEDPNKPLGDSYASEAERAAAVMAAAKGAKGTPVELLAGAIKGRTGDWAAQLKAVDAALAKVGDAPLALALQEQRALALAGLGKHADAAAAWAKVAAGTQTAVGKALAQLHMGDLYNPNTGSKAADAAKAKAAYGAAMKALAASGKAPKEGVEAFIYTDARIKSARL